MINRIPLIICIGILSLAVAGCSADSTDDNLSALEANAGAQDNYDFKGQFQMTAAAPFNVSADDTFIRCQHIPIAQHFLALWTHEGANVGIQVTAKPFDDAGGESKTEGFSVRTLDGNSARLDSASLTVTKIKTHGAWSAYEVSARGTFSEGGTFTATGLCQA